MRYSAASIPQRMAEEMRGPITAIVPSLIHETMEEYAAHLGKPAAAGTRTGGAQGDGGSAERDRRHRRGNPPASGRGAGLAPDGDRCLQARSRPVDPHFPDGRQTRIPFIELSGLIFGIPFGLLQMFIWFFIQPWWFLTFGGALVGGFINWLAIVMIFNPKQPRKFGPFTLHGLFMRRQSEVATAYSKMVADELLNPQNIVDGILKGPLSDSLFRIISKHVKPPSTRKRGWLFLQFMIGTQRYIEMKNRAVTRSCWKCTEAAADHSRLQQTGDGHRNPLRDKSLLPVEDFEDIITPVFKEDEWILIALGVVLSGLVGYLQWYLGF